MFYDYQQAYAIALGLFSVLWCLGLSLRVAAYDDVYNVKGFRVGKASSPDKLFGGGSYSILTASTWASITRQTAIGTEIILD